MDQEEPDALELLTGHMPEDVTTKNQAPLNLALLQVRLHPCLWGQSAEWRLSACIKLHEL